MKVSWGFQPFRGQVFKGGSIGALSAASLLALANTAYAADVAIDLRAPADILSAGAVLAYTLEVRNNGPQAAGPATGIETVFAIPHDGALHGEYIDYEVVGGIGTCSHNSGTHEVTCTNLPDLPFSETISINVRVRLPDAGVYEGVARVATLSNDPNPINNRMDIRTTVQAASDLILRASAFVPANTPAGMPYSYTLDVSNNGPDDMPAGSRMEVSFQVPSGASVTSVPTGAGWTCSAQGSPAFPLSNGELITCRSAQVLDNGDPASPITVPAVSNVQGDISASFRVAGYKGNGDPLPDGNEANNEDSRVVSFLAGSDVSITKRIAAPGAVVGVGGEVTYRLTPRHEGGQQPGQSGLITVTDTLGAGLSYQSASGSGWNCSDVSNTVTCTRPGPWTGGNFSEMPYIDVKAIADNAGQLSNRAEIQIPETDSNPGNNTSSVNITSSDEADLAMFKQGPRYAVSVNEPYTYYLAVRNNGPLALPAGRTIRVTDMLPADVAVMESPTGTGWDCTASDITATPAVIDCSRTGELSSDADTDYIQIPVRATAPGTLTNTACVALLGTGLPFDRNATNDCAGASTVVSSETADLMMEKNASSSTIRTGDPLTYTLKVTNKGPDESRDIVIEDRLESLLNDGGLQSVSISPAPAPAPDYGCRLGDSGPFAATLGVTNGSSQMLTCKLDRLGVGAETTITVDVLPLVATNAPRVNEATVYSLLVGEGEGNRNDNTDSASSNVTALVDIEARKTRPSETIPAGAPLSFTASVYNDGPSTASSVRLVDTLPGNAPFLGLDDAGGGACIPPAIGSVGQELICTWDAVASKDIRNVRYRLRAVEMGDTISNTVEVSTTTEEHDVLPNTASTSTEVTAAILDITVSKSDDPNIVALGESTTYTIRITNAGPSAATELTMTDTFPSNSLLGEAPTALFSYQGGLRVMRGTTDITGDTSQYSCTEPAVGLTAGTLSCSFEGYFDSGNAEIISISYAMRAETITSVLDTGTAFNRVDVDVKETEERDDNNHHVESTSTRRDSVPADLSGTKKATPGALVKGQNVVYNIVVTNNGGLGGTPVDSVGAVLTDPLPSGLQFVSAAPAGACSHAGGTVTCQVGALPSGQSRTFSITAKLEENYSGPNPLVNQASIHAPGDPEPGNNDPSDDSPVIESAVGAPTLSHLGLFMLTLLLSGLAWRTRRRA